MIRIDHSSARGLLMGGAGRKGIPMRLLSLALLSGLAALVATAAGAAPVSPIELHVDYGGVYYNTYNQNDLGCAAGSGENFECSGSNFNMGDLTLKSWSLSFDRDPVQ